MPIAEQSLEDHGDMNAGYGLDFARMEDVTGWMRLADLVKDNFPGFDARSYEKTLVKNIARQSALCVRHGDVIVGVLLFSISAQTLSCMAVHPDHRKRGIASMLVARMIECFPADCDIW